MIVYLKTSTLNSWIIDKYFPEKDLVTVEELINVIEELDGELDHIREQLEDIIQDRDDNYKRKSVEEQIGWK